MIQLLYVVALLLGSPGHLRAPECTVRGSLQEHVAAARAVGVAYDVDPSLLLAIARHESCFDNRVVTGVCSGVMQTMGRRPRTMLEGYERGAQEIREWMRVSRGRVRLALSGYSGGWRTWRSCREGGDCGFADVFERWARNTQLMMDLVTENPLASR